jgi:hypothetical protein
MLEPLWHKMGFLGYKNFTLDPNSRNFLCKRYHSE